MLRRCPIVRIRDLVGVCGLGDYRWAIRWGGGSDIDESGPFVICCFIIPRRFFNVLSYEIRVALTIPWVSQYARREQAGTHRATEKRLHATLTNPCSI